MAPGDDITVDLACECDTCGPVRYRVVFIDSDGVASCGGWVDVVPDCTISYSSDDGYKRAMERACDEWAKDACDDAEYDRPPRLHWDGRETWPRSMVLRAKLASCLVSVTRRRPIRLASSYG